jgi:peptide/nickel transport system substrate-binding protein
MKRLRLQLIIVLLALVAIAALLLSQQPALQAVEVAPAPAEGGIYSEALVGTPGRFNPLLDIYNPVDRDVDRLIFSGLIKFDERGLPQPDLAESWGVSQDGTTYNFALRPDALWHDGEPVTSDDVIFTIELMSDENFPTPEDTRKLWNSIEVRRMNDKTIQFRLPEPYAPFLDQLTFGILPFHLLGDLSPQEIINAPFNLNPVGTGPYLFDSLVINEGEINGVVLKAFENYYLPRAFIEQFVFRYYPDITAALDAYDAGDVLGVGEIPVETLPRALAEPNLGLYSGRLPELSLVLFNLDNEDVPFFQELEVRKALYMGLNRQYMIDTIMNGQAILASGPIYPGTWAYYDDQVPVTFSPEASIDILRKAGYTIPAEGGSVRAKEGVRLAFELVYPDEDYHAALAQSIQKYWAALGVDVTLKAVSYDELVQDYLNPRDYQAALVDFTTANSPDPDPYPFWHQAQTPNGQNYSNWDDRQASEYLETARVTADIGERERLYRNFQVRFDQEIPALPLFYPVYSFAVDNQVQGVRTGPLFDMSDRFAHVTEWFLFVERPGNQGAETTTPSPAP